MQWAPPPAQLIVAAGAPTISRSVMTFRSIPRPSTSPQIDRAASEIAVQGARYPENLERMTGR
jgi:hypothetical protein